MATPKKVQAAAEWVHINVLVPWAKNEAIRPTGPEVEEIRKSILEFGFGAPIVARRANNEIIKGHKRRLAVLSIPDLVFPDQPAPGMVPVRYLDVSEKTAHKLALSDNKIAEIAKFDELALAEEIATLFEDEEEMSLPGFEEEEMAAIFASDDDPEGGGEPEPAAPAPTGSPVEVAPPTVIDDAFVLFRFGDYSGRVARPVYDTFVATYRAKQSSEALPMLDDVLRAWLGLAGATEAT